MVVNVATYYAAENRDQQLPIGAPAIPEIAHFL